MARSDLVISLAKAANSGDRNMARKTTEAIIAEERSKNHQIFAKRLTEVLRDNNDGLVRGKTSNSTKSINSLLYESTPEKSFNDLILEDNVQSLCHELIEEHRRADLLRSYNLEPRSRLLFIGPPGNGKTSLAEAFAYELMVPFFVIRYEGLIGSYLGETASRLNKVFEHVRTYHCVFFIDEFDTIGKERGDTHETGEIKRVVSSLLLQIDALPSNVIVITASNHPELLDRAVWRRFQVKVSLNNPTRAQIEQWFLRFFDQFKDHDTYSEKTLAKYLYGLSFGEIEQFGLDVQRAFILNRPDASLREVISEKLKQWKTYQGIKKELTETSNQ